jgi:acetyl esterase/lipase
MRRTISFHRISSRIAVSLIAMLLLADCCPLTEPIPTTPPTTVLTTAPPLTATLSLIPTTVSTSAPTSTTIPSPTATVTPLTIEITEDIPYAYVDGDTTSLDVYAPSEPGPWPVIVTAHGWAQDQDFLMPLAEAIASRGAVVYNVNVDYGFPNLIGIKRIACAIRFARATAEDNGGDPNRITLVGSSLGAASGAVVALAGDDFEGDCVENDASALPDALVAFEGPYDYALKAYNPALDHTILEEEDPELWEAINPYSHIGRNPDLQVRLLHGEDEGSHWWDISPQVSIDFQQALKDAGYDVTLTIVEFTGHTALGWDGSEVFQIAIQQTLEVAHNPPP